MTLATDIQRLRLGLSGPEVSAIGIGTWSWGDSLFWSYGKDYGQADLQAAFEAALDSGIDFFDTAEIYGFGQSERLLGQFMQQSGRSACIATKYFPLPWRWGEQAVAKALRQSLDRLGLETVTLYQVHWPFDFLLGQQKLLGAIAQEVAQGRIQAVGISNYSALQMQQAHRLLADCGIPLACNQMNYSLLERSIEQNGVLEAAQNLDMTVLAYCPLAQGLLTGKYRAQSYQAPAGARQFDARFSQRGLQRLEPLFQLLDQIATNHDRTPAQVALNWLLQQGPVLPIPGAKSASQARQNAGALGWRLAPEEIAQLSDSSQLLSKG
jgi:aryl-alcohol dehydrogenase-like predicted oxidoreductase